MNGQAVTSKSACNKQNYADNHVHPTATVNLDFENTTNESSDDGNLLHF
jgi:hypothetical protein